MHIRHAALLVVAPLFVACRPQPASLTPRDSKARQAVLLTAHDLAPGRRCRIVDPEAPLPDVATIVDTAAMPEFLRQASISARDTGYALFSLRYDSTGKPVRARLIEATTPDSIADALGEVIASAVVQRAPGNPIAARLRIDFTTVLTYRLGKSEYCDPEQITVHFAQDPRATVETHGPSVSRTMTTYKYETDISASGAVLAIRFDSFIEPAVEVPLRESMMKQRYEPALDDGAPVAGHATGSMRIEMRLVTRTIPGH
ncbi:MAG: hypothetical protein ACJ79K_03235 [Gemmatimonadaceae bacterium]